MPRRITTFNFPVEDYANIGTIQGVQTEVQILLNQLSTLLPNSSGVVDGLVKSSSHSTNDQSGPRRSCTRPTTGSLSPMTAAWASITPRSPLAFSRLRLPT